MSYYMYGSTAYEIDEPTHIKKNKTTTVRHKKNKNNKQKNQSKNMQTVVLVVVLFALLFTTIYRKVVIYGQHNELDSQKKALETLTMENDQLEVSIDSMVDDSKVEEYAKEKLGLQKLETRQIIYLEPDDGDKMKKVSKKKPSMVASVFGILFNN